MQTENDQRQHEALALNIIVQAVGDFVAAQPRASQLAIAAIVNPVMGRLTLGAAPPADSEASQIQ